MDEEQAVRRFAEGSTEAFAIIYNRYHAGIYNFLLRITKNPTLTEDLVHDVFLKLWEARHRLESRDALAPYLYQIAKNTAFTQLSRLGLYDSILREVLQTSDSNRHDAHTASEAKALQGLIQQAITGLPPQRREAYILCRQYGKTYEEAASLMNISKNTLKQHLSLAVKSIKEFLRANGYIVVLFYYLSKKYF